MIPHYKNIIYTTDFAENAKSVFRYALSIALMYKARLHVIHVVPEMDPSHLNYLSALIGEERYKQLEENLKKEIIENFRMRLSDFAKEELSGSPDYLCLDVEVEVLHGDPTDQILKSGERLDADLIVMGSHSKGSISHTWLGSVSHRVLRKSHRPVMVVPVA